MSEADAINGYRFLWAVPELWKFKTTFASWYSRSFQTVGKPLLQEWELADFHAPRLS